MAVPATTTSLSAQQQLQLLQKALNGPARALLPVVKPNFVNPPNLEKEFYVDLIFFLTISVLVMFMRIWTKAHLVRKVQIDDYKKLRRLFFVFHFQLALPPFSPTNICDEKVKRMEGLYKSFYIGVCVFALVNMAPFLLPSPCAL